MKKNSVEMREVILSSVRQKTGIRDIHLESTHNAKARIVMRGKIQKDFINQADALQWLIYTYNIKHLKNPFFPLHTHPLHFHKTENKESTKESVIEEASQILFEKISTFEHYTSEIYHTLQNDIDQLKYNENFTTMEMKQIYMSVIKRLKRLLDDTFSHKKYQVYKKYLERLKERKYDYQ